MGPALGYAIGAGIGALGNIISGNSNAKQARENYQHRYQWAVQDMKKAGLNPALAYGQSQPIPQTQGIEPLGDAMVKGGEAAARIGQATAARQLTQAQTKLLNAQSEDLITNVQLKNALLYQQAITEGLRGVLTEQQSFAMQQTVEQLKMRTDYDRKTFDQRVELVAKDLERRGIEIERAKLEKALRALDRPGKEAQAKFWNQTGSASQWLKMMLDASRFVP